MKPYSLDLRKRVLAACATRSSRKPRLRNSSRFISRPLEKWPAAEAPRRGAPTALPHGGGRTRTLRECEQFLRAEVKQQPDVTLEELCTRVAEAQGYG